tara:strand:+ start:169 stop:975 length:807 start_codon:yes stop_codon:yes gene_type:complete
MSAQQALDQYGPLPQIDWLSLAALMVDHTYQRQVNADRKSAVAAMAEGWDWMKYQPISVSRRGPGSFAIVDGQHRYLAALRAGLQQLPCYILPGDPVIRDEASAFVGINKDRVKVHPIYVFYAQLAAGDEEVQVMKQVLDASGIVIPRHPGRRDLLQEGQTYSIGAITKALQAYGPALVETVLTALRKAYAGTGEGLSGSVIRSAAGWLHEDGENVPVSHVSDFFGDIDFEDIDLAAKQWVRMHGGSKKSAVNAALRTQYDRWRRRRS